MLAVVVFSIAASFGTTPTVDFDSRSFVLDGNPELLLSGVVHYARVLPADWNRTFSLMSEMGLNTVQTYVMWNFHEHVRGELVWTGRRDLALFLKTAQDHGLSAVVRIGPYVCGEYYFGGIPIWLRSVDDVQCFRCSDPVWMRESIKFVASVVEELTSKKSLHPQGGNVIMLQIENEWNGPSDEVENYLLPTVDAARNITTMVPWNLCHDQGPCSVINKAPGAPADGKGRAICTINGFWEELRTSDPHQPSMGWISEQRENNPKQPLMWTEDQGWFDQWGVAQRVRFSSDQAYGILRAFANGLSYHSFYMVTGGSNFGLQSGGEVVTAYAPDTVIDYLLLRHQPRFDYYGKMFKTLTAVKATLLASKTIPQPVPFKKQQATATITTRTAAAAPLPGLGMVTCYQYSEPNQQWAFDATTGSLKAQANSSLCVALSYATKSVVLAECDTTSPDQKWTYDAALMHVKNTGAEHPCRAKGAEGQCYDCLDRETGGALDAWDCKAKDVDDPANQQWKLGTGSSTNRESSFTQIVYAASVLPGECLSIVAAPPAPAPAGDVAEYHEYGPDASGRIVAFLSNFGTSFADAGAVTYRGSSFFLSNHSVVIVSVENSINNPNAAPMLLFNSSDINDTGGPTHLAEMLDTGRATRSASVPVSGWTAYQEPIGMGLKTVVGAHNAPPHEQLNLTDNNCDYLWYTTPVPTATLLDMIASDADVSADSVTLSLKSGSIGYVYINGVLVGDTLSSSTAEYAAKTPVDPASLDTSAARATIEHVVELNATALRAALAAAMDVTATTNAATTELQVLSVAMGLSNGGVGPHSTKGLVGVQINGKQIVNTTTWTHSYMLHGTADAVNPTAATPAVKWGPVAAIKPSYTAATATWFKTKIDMPKMPLGVTAPTESDPYPQLAYALDMSSMNKGVAYFNGCVARHVFSLLLCSFLCFDRSHLTCPSPVLVYVPHTHTQVHARPLLARERQGHGLRATAPRAAVLHALPTRRRTNPVPLRDPDFYHQTNGQRSCPV